MKPPHAPAATFLSSIGKSDLRSRLLRFLALHGGTTTLQEMLDLDAPDLVVHTLADFLDQGVIVFSPDLNVAKFARNENHPGFDVFTVPHSGMALPEFQPADVQLTPVGEGLIRSG